MGVDIRFPSITGTTEKERLRQMESYLFQVVEQLNWALQNVDTANTTVAAPTARSQAVAEAVGGSGATDPQGAFNAIKSLIIKSAEIVDAYSEEVRQRLEGYYVAESDFGTYMEHTSQELEQNSTSTTQKFENLQTIITGVNEGLQGVEQDLQESKAGFAEDIQALQTMVIDVTSYIKSGLLYYNVDGVPMYGIEVGQTVGDSFRKYARFSSEKLSFYDSNDIEVAYISDKKLYIGAAEITLSLKMGGFMDLVMPNGDIVTKWVGGV